MKEENTAKKTTPLRESDQALLILLKDQEAVQNLILDKPVTTIGRWEDNDVIIPDRWVSRHHAQIRREGTRHIVEDLDSKNGLFVNGRRVTQPVALEDGDRIQIAPHYALDFVDSEATAPLFQRKEDILIDESACRVWVKGRELDPPLSRAQFALLKALVSSPGHVYSRRPLWHQR
jgi:DNA-binding response OmpR family regulator